MTLGQRIRYLREEKDGLTQEKLGELVGVSKASFSKYEADDIEPSNGTLNFLCDYFDCTLDYLFGRSEVRKYPSREEFEKKLLESEFAKKIKPLTEEQKKTLITLAEVWDKENREKKL